MQDDVMRLKSLREALMPLRGSDGIVKRMLDGQIPMTQEAYLDFNYPDGVPELTEELLSEVPEPLRDT